MNCPFCTAPDTKVVDSRLTAEGERVRRRRECPSCSGRFTTYEAAELDMPQVVKADGRREEYSEAKLKAGLLRALEKRPVGLEAVESLIRRIRNQARAGGERELPARTIGDWVMDELRALDPVAYVRFASVYRSFQDVEAFRAEIDRLQSAGGSDRAPR